MCRLLAVAIALANTALPSFRDHVSGRLQTYQELKRVGHFSGSGPQKHWGQREGFSYTSVERNIHAKIRS